MIGSFLAGLILSGLLFAIGFLAHLLFAAIRAGWRAIPI